MDTYKNGVHWGGASCQGKIVCGAVTKGTVFYRKEDGYKRLEYIGNNTINIQHQIDTGVNVAGDLRIQLDVEILTGSHIAAASLLGGSMGAPDALSLNLSFGNNLAYYYDSLIPRFITNTNYLGRHVVELNRGVVIGDGMQLSSQNPKNFEHPISVGLFRIRVTGAQDTRTIPQRIYGAKIWKNDVLVRDFIPAMSCSKRPGLWDNVDKKMYYNVNESSPYEEFEYSELT